MTNLIWDFDGTLFDTYPAMTMAFQETLAGYGIKADIQEIYDYLKITVSTAINHYAELNGLSKLELREKFVDNENQLSPQWSMPFDGVKKICETIKQLGGRNFIVTHRNSSIFRFLDFYNMEKYFEEVVNDEYGFKKKPNPQAFSYVIDKYKLDPDKTWGVGDREIDVTAAKAAGVKACLFTNNPDTNTDADILFSSFDELLLRLQALV